MLKLKDIKKDYKTAGTVVHALKGVSLEFRANEFVSVLGTSGCGKTTLLNIIGGLDQYTSGDLVIRGISTKDYDDRDWDVYRNHRIGFVFQSYNLIPQQSVLENVEIALTIAGCSKAERKKRAAEALKKVGLGEQMNKRPNQLSGGQMQRVAIARALVNNPEILLADEPTGALDSTTSVQIMELIREIAGERLVIMVTHNPELAEKYSSRIVRLQDGLVVSDSNPYDSGAERKALEAQLKKKGITPEQVRAWKKRKIEREGASAEKASMNFGTSLSLSARNLRAKKGRTMITSIAGSIGIISVCLVLALSHGFNRYILKTEEDMLSYYPLQITESSIDTASIMSGMSSHGEMPDLSQLDDKVYVNSFLTKIAKGMTVTNNLSPEYISYIEEMDENLYSAIQYGYGTNLSDSLFTEVVTGVSESSSKKQNMSLSALKEFYVNELTVHASEYAQIAYMVDYLGSVVHTMPGTDELTDERYGDYIATQYDVIAGEFPKSDDEAVLVIGGNNDATDLLLAQLGFIEEYNFLELFEKGESETDDYMTIDFDDILNKKYTLFYNDEIYKKSVSALELYPFTYQGERETLEAAEGRGINVKISGILRIKDGLTYGCLSSGLNISEATVNKYIAENMKSEIVKWMTDPANAIPYESDGKLLTLYRSPAEHLNSYYSAVEGYPIRLTTNQMRAIRSLGGSDMPNSIAFYPTDFTAKDKIIDYLDAWNNSHEESQQVTYTDTVGLMMGMIQTMLNAVTYVLVAFTAISLIVSSVMIGVITYVSVVERTKEIGVLRSLGARKRDIKNLFNAETFLIGLFAGAIGVGVTYLLSIPINLIFGALTGISTLAALPVWQGIVMIAVSIVLTLISGLVPAQSAAKKDPVIALRTE